jgi:mono/diheme cytochrome c family protein
MLIRGIFPFIGLMLCLAASGELQQKQIKYVPARPISPVSGQQMYTAYCAVCHGPNGKGNGPAAEGLTVPPPDLTALARKNGGKYPSDHVRNAIEGDLRLSTTGLNGMPAWGDLFWRMSQGHSSEVQLRVSNLNEHIESLQAK